LGIINSAFSVVVGISCFAEGIGFSLAKLAFESEARREEFPIVYFSLGILICSNFGLLY